MKNLISQGLRLGQKVSKGFRKWLKDKMGKCVNCAKSVMQIFKLTKLTEQIFATYATYASANFVGKESNESTEMYRVKSRIPSIYSRLTSDSNLSRFCVVSLIYANKLLNHRTTPLGRFVLPEHLPFSKPKVNWLLHVSLICLCMLTIGSGNVWGAAVASQAPANGKSFIIALYYNNKYYALPHLTTTGVTPAGLECTLDANNKVSAISTCDSPDDCLWDFATATGGYYISFVNNNTTMYLYKNGTTGDNYKISANSNYQSNSIWAFTSGTANSVTAYSVKTTKSTATKHTVIKAKSNTSFQVNGTSNSYSVTLLAVAPRITCATTSLSGFTYVQGSGPSAAQSFSVSGSHLTANITVTAPTNYEVSTSSGSGYGNSVTLTKNASGVVSATTVYVRLKSGLSANTYNGSISIASTGATTKSITLSGSVTAPASTWKFKYSGDDYTAHTMTEAAGVASYSLDLAADTRYEFGFDDNGSAFYKNQGTIITTTSGWVFNTSDNNCKIHTGPAGTYTFAINTTTKAVTVTYPTVSHPNDHYVYFKNTDSWGTVKGYLGNTGNDNKAAAWPGSDMQVTTEICGKNYYYAALNAMSGTYNVIVFNNGSGSKTSDLSTTGSLGKFNANQDANWHDFKYSITFAGNGNTSGSMSDVSNICIGSNQTLASNGFTKTNYNFTGWVADVDVKIGGSTVTAGTLIANAATIQDIQSNITLTAQWVHVPEITASETARAFGDRKVNGGPYNMTFNVSGQYLTGNISLAITGTNAGMFSVNKTSLTPSTGTVATTEITVSYSPTGAGSHTATLTISSDGATSKTVALSGTGKWEVVWSVNGGETTSLVANGTKPTLPSPAPSSCDATSTTFMGWATSSWPGKLDDVSDKTIHTSNSTMDNVTANGTTFYAVFAKASGSGGAAVSTVLWAETFSGWSGGNVPSGDYTNSHTGTTVYGDATVTYACEDGNSDTKLYAQTNAGGSSPELLINQSGGSYTITGIPTGGAATMTLTYRMNNTNISAATSGTSGISVGSRSGSNPYSQTITNTGDVSSFDLVFENTSGSNGRIDNFSLVVATQGISYSEYLTSCVACTSDPDMTSAASALKGVFSSSSVGVTATDWSTGSAYCSWADYGFVWGTSANPTVSDTKVQVGTSGSVTTWDGNLTGSFAINTTYHYRAYGKNSKDGATIQYSSDQTFTPRNVTFNLNGHGESAPSTQFVNNGSKATDPSYSEVVTGWAFGGWYKEAGCTNAWNFASDVVSGESKTLYAKWTEKPKYTITLNAGNGTVSAAGWTAGDAPTWWKTQSNGDEAITFPSASCNCAGWEFIGWATSAADNAGSDPTSKAAGDDLVPASNVTYYAVYRQSTPGGTTYTKITTVGELKTGNYVITGLYNGTSPWKMVGSVKNDGVNMNETSASVTDNALTESTALNVWTIMNFGSYVAFRNTNTGKFLAIVDGKFALQDDGQKFTYSVSSGAWTFTSPSGKQIAYASTWVVAESQNRAVHLFKQNSTPSGNYYTSPSCTSLSVTGVANPVAGGTVDLTATAAKSGDKVWACYTADEDYNFSEWTKTGTGATLSSTTAQFTELTVGSTDATVTANFVAKDWKTVTWMVNGAALSGGDLGSASVKVENGYNITAIPPTPTSCDGTSTTFMGWLPDGEEWSGTIDDVSAKDIYANVAAFPTVTANVTYHAVWAKKTGGSGNETLTCTAGTVEGSTTENKTITMNTTNFTFVHANTYGSASAVASYSPWRVYEKHTVTISGSYTITQVDIVHSDTYYGILSSDKGTLTLASTSGGTTTIEDINATSVEIQNASGASQSRWSSIKVYYDNATYDKYLVKCCDDPELEFVYTGVATAEELVRENKARLDAADAVVLTYATSSAGTITAPTAASVNKLSSYGDRNTTGGTAASAQVDAISIDTDDKVITLSIKTTSSGGNTGCGTYRVALTQAAYNSGGDNYCEKTAYGFVDVKIKYEFIDAVNGNTTVIKYNTGNGVLFPTEGELSGGSDCHSETRVLKGWISETKLTSLYGGSNTRVLTLDDVKDAANTIVAPGADGKGIYAQGTKWYAVWAYEK